MTKQFHELSERTQFTIIFLIAISPLIGLFSYAASLLIDEQYSKFNPQIYSTGAVVAKYYDDQCVVFVKINRDVVIVPVTPKQFVELEEGANVIVMRNEGMLWSWGYYIK